MKQLKWHFKHGTKYETYSVLYEDKNFMLVRNNDTNKYSFGVIEDFGSLYGFPVNQSCLTMNEATSVLNDFIKIDKQYSGCPFADTNIKRWKDMLLTLA